MHAEKRPSHDAAADPRLHHDVLADRTVFVAPRRADRPFDLDSRGPSPAAACPFCAGNESMTPQESMRLPEGTAAAWHVRIIPNRFPAVEELSSAPGVAAAAGGGSRPAHGVHEVVIESPTHVASILGIEPARWRDAWELCRRRLASLADRDDLAWATVFKNSGAAAGASLEHLHSQLIALDFVHPAMQAKLAAAARAADAFGDLLTRAEADERIVAEAGDLVALVPPAPRQPCETWIVPRGPERHFHVTSPARVAAIAALTRQIVGGLDRLVPGAAYNWWLHQAPFDRFLAAHAAAAGGWRWHLEILPRLSGLAGFELGTGCHITTASPRDSARRLRGG